jgi:hypothetical protein
LYICTWQISTINQHYLKHKYCVHTKELEQKLYHDYLAPTNVCKSIICILNDNLINSCNWLKTFHLEHNWCQSVITFSFSRLKSCKTSKVMSMYLLPNNVEGSIFERFLYITLLYDFESVKVYNYIDNQKKTLQK